ncbi:MAG: tRNA adenosine(34) deaminase TadA [bacterium]|nr:tRNA adenosine(34) deaminase TadA [bacterium]
MAEALEQARLAAIRGEVPVGAVVVWRGQVVARAHNRREETADATAHAELLAIQGACRRLGSWRLNEAILYVTLEPCPMCAGAMVQARLAELVYGARDPKAGAAGSLVNLVEDDRFNHRVKVTGGVREEECAAVLRDFFRARRGSVPEGCESG